VLGHSEQELNRLRVQARLINPITRQFFVEAGIAPGMRVLDVGSGAGDVAFLGAELVGAAGRIVGVDRSRTALVMARARASELSLSNVEFLEGDPSAMTFEEPFDAVIGRYVLMFQDDPIPMLRHLRTLLRPGGITVFHEVDWVGARSFPPVPLYDRCCKWLVEAMERSGADTRMGIKLYSAFLAAGFPAPVTRLHSVIGGGMNASDQVQLNTDLVATLASDIVRLGIATEAEIGIETLTERVIEEVTRRDCVVVGREEIGAWSRAQ
jgi:ubiquinone/menaquinone biosynthesis C-methylase UbiE